MSSHKRNNRDHILQTAVKLFAEKGFDATTVDSIADSAGVNKALIYYYFKNKKDIIASIFQEMMVKMGQSSGEADISRKDVNQIKGKIGKEIDFLKKNNEALSLLFMETLKLGNDGFSLLQLARPIIERELDARGFKVPEKSAKADNLYKKALVHEFFTGIIPVISFVILGEKFATEFDMTNQEINEIFLDAFEKSHLDSHLKTTD